MARQVLGSGGGTTATAVAATRALELTGGWTPLSVLFLLATLFSAALRFENLTPSMLHRFTHLYELSSRCTRSLGLSGKAGQESTSTSGLCGLTGRCAWFEFLVFFGNITFSGLIQSHVMCSNFDVAKRTLLLLLTLFLGLALVRSLFPVSRVVVPCGCALVLVICTEHVRRLRAGRVHSGVRTTTHHPLSHSSHLRLIHRRRHRACRTVKCKICSLED